MQRINAATQAQGKAKGLLNEVKQAMGATPGIYAMHCQCAYSFGGLSDY